MRDRPTFLVIALGALIFGVGRSAAQEVDRGKAEVQAAGQATEADRLFKLGEFEAALPIYEAERASRAALGDLRYEAYALRAIGICRAELGDDEAAIGTWNKARDLDLRRDDPGYAGYDDFLIGAAEIRLGRADRGIAALARSLPRLSQGVDRDHEADARLALARILVATGRAEEAGTHVDRALVLADELADLARRADGWASAGQVAGALGRPSEAIERFSHAREAFEEQGRAAEAAWMETTIASSLVLLGRPDLALARFEEAARLHDHLDDGGSVAEDLSAVAGLLLDARRLDEAKQQADRAVAKAVDADDRPREVEARVRLAQVQGAQGDWKGAVATLEEAVNLNRQVARDDPAEQVRLILTLADASSRAGLEDVARQRLESARSIAHESGLAPLIEIVTEARQRFDDRSRLGPRP